MSIMETFNLQPMLCIRCGSRVAVPFKIWKRKWRESLSVICEPCSVVLAQQEFSKVAHCLKVQDEMLVGRVGEQTPSHGQDQVPPPLENIVP